MLLCVSVPVLLLRNSKRNKNHMESPYFRDACDVDPCNITQSFEMMTIELRITNASFVNKPEQTTDVCFSLCSFSFNAFHLMT